MKEGETFDGTADENGKPHGFGRLEYANGVYNGDFKHGEFHGRGKLVLKNGHTYDGQFKNGKQDGEGHMIKGNVTVKGTFRCGNPHGHCIERNEIEGWEYCGNLDYGIRDDYGEMTYFSPHPKAGEVYSGFFFRGELSCTSGRLTVGGREFTGKLHNGKFRGIVEIKEPNGVCSKAIFERGVQQQVYSKKRPSQSTDRAAMYATD